MDKDKFNEFVDNEAKRMLDDLIKKSTKEHFKQEFAEFDCNALPHMTDKELALWQAKHPMDSPQYIIALQEWNRRATAEQIKSMRFATVITAGASITAAILGAWAGATWTKTQQQSQLPPSIVESYKPPAESKDGHPAIKKIEAQQIKKIKWKATEHQYPADRE